MRTLQTDTTLRETAEGLVVDLSRNWRATWGPNGGYVGAIALRAAGRKAPAGHRPATLSLQYLRAAEFAPALATVTAVKQGSKTAMINVVLTQDGTPFLQAQVWTICQAQTISKAATRMPSLAAPSATENAFEDAYGGSGFQGFWSNFDRKSVAPAPAAAPESRLQEWFRFRDFDAQRNAFLDGGRAVVLLDTLNWRTFKLGLTTPPDYFAPNLDLTVWFHQPAPDADWLLADMQAEAFGAGLVHGCGRIWTGDGRLVATGATNMLITAPPPGVRASRALQATG